MADLDIERYNKQPSWADGFTGMQDWRYYACDNESNFKYFGSTLRWWGYSGALTGASVWWRDGRYGRPVPAVPTIGRITAKFLLAGVVYHGTESLLLASMGKHHWSQQAAGGTLVGALFPLLAGLRGRGVYLKSLATGVTCGAFMGGARGVGVQQEYFGHVLRAKAKRRKEKEAALAREHELETLAAAAAVATKQQQPQE